MIPEYPKQTELSLSLRPALHPQFQKLADGISEYTFANLYLFRKGHHYRVSRMNDSLLIVSGSDQGRPFFMLPFGLPEPSQLKELFSRFSVLKCVSEGQGDELKRLGYNVNEDRDNFDYLYRRRDLAELAGRKFHKKRNLIKAFSNHNMYEARPLLDQYVEDALTILADWSENREDKGDYQAAREGLEHIEELQLCGGIYYVDEKPVAYSLGEENNCGKTFVIHFEKAIPDYKGLWQFVNQAFASILPPQYETINREQDLGDEGLRRAKMSYKPIGFVKKFTAAAA